MSDKFILTGIEIFGHHGDLPEEKKLGQKFLIDLELNLDLSVAGKSDALEDTVDYPKILALTEKIIGGESKNLIETVAEELAEKILADFPKVEGVKVVLHKPYAPLKIKYLDAAVEIFRSRG